MATQEPDQYKKFLLFLTGCFTLVFGIALILIWWSDVVSLFRGGLGIVLALAGLLILYGVSK